MQTCTYESYDDYIAMMFIIKKVNIGNENILKHRKWGYAENNHYNKYILVVKYLIDDYSVYQFALMFLYNKIYVGTLLEDQNNFYQSYLI